MLHKPPDALAASGGFLAASRRLSSSFPAVLAASGGFGGFCILWHLHILPTCLRLLLLTLALAPIHCTGRGSLCNLAALAASGVFFWRLWRLSGGFLVA